ncbi:GNAT family N-acetyltransferase [Saccharothrix violaceirubra]|uniref:GNAT superfamily N-acetyltransferase n=1 Tax=Saccharothrix violaceirubra TaxID=413306 RepID=A0A7W7WW86_9PSEU|nr:GNAT family N-acetyltransferase [Saccharothrix violaceirubra]MBB4966139.1 GNAT superfamily N-acetyltransferase [Saccharothrix violaceirubra]
MIAWWLRPVRFTGPAERLIPVKVTAARVADVASFLGLAGHVEQWFGPMVDQPGFRDALRRNIDRGTAMCVRPQDGGDLRGGILFTIRPPVCRIGWLVVAPPDRGTGVGRALVTEVVRRLDGSGMVEVITFGEDHPAARPSGARTFYLRLGFAAQEPADPGPDGTSRQWFRRRVVS